MIGIGLRIGLFGSGSIDAQAQAHYNRVIADGGVVPAGVSGTNAFFNAVKTIYATSDITTAVSVGVDAHYLGYKLGAGAGATSGQAVQKLYSCAGSSGDVVQTTAASQPLLLAHSGASSDNYWYGSGGASNYVSTPNATANQISSDFEAIIKLTLPSWTGTLMTLFATYGNGTPAQVNYSCDLTSSGRLAVNLNVGGTIIFRSMTNPVGLSPNTLYWIKITRVVSTGVISFSYSTNGTSYTLLESITATSGALNTSNQPLIIGSYDNGTQQNFLGKIHNFTLAKSIGGTPVVDFNPSSYNASTSQTQWTSTTGEVWTINTGTATTGYKGVLVDRTTAQGDGIDDLMAVTMSSKQYFSLYLAINGLSSSGNVALFNGGTGDTHLIFQTSSSNINAYNGVALPFVGEVANRLFCATVNFNSTNSDTLYNDANKQTGNTGTRTSSGINIFGGAGNSFSNSIYNTLLLSLAVDTTIRNTAMYNYIRSINNNAF